MRLLLLSLLLLFPALSPATEKPNVLFIAIDDLNHWVGHLGRNPRTKTPNIDRLAGMGVTFLNAQCAAPVCNPSRAALLSGRRPGTTGVYDNQNPYAGVIPPSESLVTHFKNGGYNTIGIGKLWHGGLGFPSQWTTIGKETVVQGKVDDRSIGGIRFGITAGGDEQVSDTSIADYGIATLAAPHEKPFFLTLGFHKPHMAWNVPRKYYDLHPLADIQLPPTRTNDLGDIPAGGQKMAKSRGDHAKVLESGRWKEAVQAYLAAISYLDGQIGRVLDAYDKSPHKANTIICLWGDHGWHLGEKEHWRKFALWEEATRAPFIWVVPGVTPPGGRCARPVDFMSVYPTLCDLAGLPRPAHVTGENIRPLLTDPSAAWEPPALTTYGQNNHALRSERWRYIRYADGGEELYDHEKDPYEWNNVADLPENAAVKKDLARWFPSTNVPEVPRTAKGGEQGTPPDPVKAARKAERRQKKPGAQKAQP